MPAGSSFELASAALTRAAQWLRLGIETSGALMIAAGVVVVLLRVPWRLLRDRPQYFVGERLWLARFLSFALEFQLAADVLETAFAPSWQQIGELAAIAAIRTVLNLSLSREIAEEREMMKELPERGNGTATP
jgi:uncharacterized membrane protein